jgi:hypothetical protein
MLVASTHHPSPAHVRGTHALVGRHEQVQRVPVVLPSYRDEKVANHDFRGFGWGIAHGAVTRRPPISLYTVVPRTVGYAYDVGVWDLSIVQRAILCRAVPNPSLIRLLPLCLSYCLSHECLSHRLSHCVSLTVSPTVSPSLCLALCLSHRLSHCVSLTVSPTVSLTVCKVTIRHFLHRHTSARSSAHQPHGVERRGEPVRQRLNPTVLRPRAEKRRRRRRVQQAGVRAVWACTQLAAPSELLASPSELSA